MVAVKLETTASELRAAADPRLEIRHLRYFVMVAETLHFGRAAKALHISQPPLSRQVRDLEEWVGVALLQRTAKGVALTEAGTVFLQEAKKILADVSRSIHLAQQAAAGELGQLAIAIDPFFDATLLTDAKERFIRNHPGVRLNFHRAEPAEQAALVRGGSIDAGFLMLPAVHGDHLTREPLLRVPAIALVSTSHPLAARSEIYVRDMARFPILDVCDQNEPAVASYGHAGRIGTMCGVPLRVSRTCSSIDRLPQMLRDSHAMALAPEGSRNLWNDDVVCLKVGDACADFTFGLLYDGARMSDSLVHFIELARRVNEAPPRKQTVGMAAA